jgi:hypothetical protein
MNQYGTGKSAYPLGNGAELELLKEEQEQLMRTGRVEIDDPKRGHIIVTMLFDEDKPGIEGKRLQVSVKRRGLALKRAVK